MPHRCIVCGTPNSTCGTSRGILPVDERTIVGRMDNLMAPQDFVAVDTGKGGIIRMTAEQAAAYEKAMADGTMTNRTTVYSPHLLGTDPATAAQIDDKAVRPSDAPLPDRGGRLRGPVHAPPGKTEPAAPVTPPVAPPNDDGK